MEEKKRLLYKERSLIVPNFKKMHPNYKADEVEFMIENLLTKIYRIEAGKSPAGQNIKDDFKSTMLRLSTPDLVELLIFADMNRHRIPDSENNDLFTQVKNTLIRNSGLPKSDPE